MRRAALAIAAFACAACGTKPHEPPTVAAAAAAPMPASAGAPAPAPAPADPIAWTIECAPASVTIAKRASVMVTIRATNTTSAAVAPDRDPLDFLVDGKRSMELSMAFGNGGRDGSWSSLPAGATATDQRNGMSIADAPGDHVISIEHAGRELARTTLHVTP